MRPPRSDIPFHPVMLLALSITLCGGSLWAADQPGAGTVLPQRLTDRATELTVGQRENVAQLLRFLADAAKELQHHDGKVIASAEPLAVRVRAVTSAPLPLALRSPPPLRLVELHHLDLPPPAAIA